MNTLRSIATARQYSRTECCDGAANTENNKLRQTLGRKGRLVIRQHIDGRSFPGTKQRRSPLGLGDERDPGSQLVPPAGKKCRNPAFRKPILPGFSTTSIFRFEASFLRVCRPTSQEIAGREGAADGSDRSSPILLIRAFENSFLLRSLLSLARDEIPPHSPRSRV